MNATNASSLIAPEEPNLDCITPTSISAVTLPAPRLPDTNIQTIDGETLGLMDMLSVLGSGIVIVPFVAILQSIGIGKSLAERGNYKGNIYNLYNTIFILPSFLSYILSYRSKWLFCCWCWWNRKFNRVFDASEWLFLSFFTEFWIKCCYSIRKYYHCCCRPHFSSLVCWKFQVRELPALPRSPINDFRWIPTASLAAVIMAAVGSMFDLDAILEVIKLNKKDAVPMLVTFFLSVYGKIPMKFYYFTRFFRFQNRYCCWYRSSYWNADLQPEQSKYSCWKTNWNWCENHSRTWYCFPRLRGKSPLCDVCPGYSKIWLEF